jgi:plastocyanin
MMTKCRRPLFWSGLLTFVVAIGCHLSRSAAEDGPPPADSMCVVEGIVTYDGPVPAPIPVAEAASVRYPIEVDPKTRGLKETTVWLDGALARRKPEAGAQPLQMDQRNFVFIPHVLTIDAGQEVEFLNSDVANHGVTATSLEPENCFNVSMALGEGYKHRFVASSHPVAIGCPVHASMSAWIYVFAHPNHAVTDERGRFRLPPLPPGRYTLQVRHADGGMRKRVPVVARARDHLDMRIEFHGEDRTQIGSKGGT